VIKDRGWERPSAEAKVFGSWEKVVGPNIAAHCKPIKLEDGVLTVEAESTAWATQLRGLAARLLTQIAREVGKNVITRLTVHGPSTGRGYQGPRWVRDRPGPRDQYE
jgi:predicted nucleic acid-binding Zn ribbon protein